jgi:hypothetical protein
MSIEITPEIVTEMGKELGSIWLANLTVDEVLERFDAKELASHLKPIDRVAGLSVSERFVGIEPAEIEDDLKQLKRQQH